MRISKNRASRANLGKTHLNGARHAAIEKLEGRTLLSTVVVNSTADVLFPNGSGLISLRNAVATGNASATPITITFDPSVFSTPKTIALSIQLGRLELDRGMTIIGPSAALTISSQDVYVDAPNVTLANLTMTDGFINNGGLATLTNDTITSGNFGVGCTLFGTTSFSNDTISGSLGAGIEIEEGNATLTDVTVSHNGGVGIYNGFGDKLKMTDVTVSGNAHGAAGQFSGAAGGGLYNDGTATLVNVTISGNTAYAGTNSTNTNGGGGIYNDTSGTLSLSDVTISGNTESGGQGTGAGGGGVTNFAPVANVTVANSIIAGNFAGNLGPDVYGSFTSLGHNLIGKTDASTGWNSSDLTGTIASPLNAKLGPLTNNGGFTQTMLPLAGSPAIGAGSVALIPKGITTDQRGLPRVVNGKVDIGAVEVQPATVVSIALTAPAAQTATAGVSKLISLGSFTESGATAPFKAMVQWGDGSANSTVSIGAAGTIPATARTFAKTGTFTVTVSVADSASHTSNSATFKVTVTAAVATGSISGEVFNDVNGDGKQDDGEMGLGLITVDLETANNTVLATATTNVFGDFSFTGLAAGTYRVKVVQITGAVATKPTGGVLTITLTAGEVSTGNLFGEKEIA